MNKSFSDSWQIDQQYERTEYYANSGSNISDTHTQAKLQHIRTDIPRLFTQYHDHLTALYSNTNENKTSSAFIGWKIRNLPIWAITLMLGLKSTRYLTS